MTTRTRRLLGTLCVLAFALHSLSDGIEWQQGGFSPAQLWLNYVAFLPVPAVMLGLHAAQRPRVGLASLAGATLYGMAFIYFAHTSLLAVELSLPDYTKLWRHLGLRYTAHGALMVVGGLLFGGAALRARVFPVWTSLAFLAGIALNVALAMAAAPEAWQALGTMLRNFGLMGMGAWLLCAAGVDRRYA